MLFLSFFWLSSYFCYQHCCAAVVIVDAILLLLLLFLLINCVRLHPSHKKLLFLIQYRLSGQQQSFSHFSNAKTIMYTPRLFQPVPQIGSKPPPLLDNIFRSQIGLLLTPYLFYAFFRYNCRRRFFIYSLLLLLKLLHVLSQTTRLQTTIQPGSLNIHQFQRKKLRMKWLYLCAMCSREKDGWMEAARKVNKCAWIKKANDGIHKKSK